MAGRTKLNVALSVVTLVALLFLESGAQAAYTKLYMVPNTTNSPQLRLQATLNGLEVITSTYNLPSAWGASSSSAVLSGVPCTTLTFGNATVAKGGSATVGWTTADGTCRLRDLRWRNLDGTAGPSVLPTSLGGVPGGGYLLQGPGAYTYTWVITNDTSGPLTIKGATLTIGPGTYQVSKLTKGAVGAVVAATDDGIRQLLGQIAQAGITPDIAVALADCDAALVDVDAAVAARNAGDQAGAQAAFARAAADIASLQPQIQNWQQMTRADPALLKAWGKLVDSLSKDLKGLINGKATSVANTRAQIAALRDQIANSQIGSDVDIALAQGAAAVTDNDAAYQMYMTATGQADVNAARALWKTASQLVSTLEAYIDIWQQTGRLSSVTWKLWHTEAGKLAQTLNGLPGGLAAQRVLPAPQPPAPPGGPATFYPWPLDVLPVGGYTAFIIQGVPDNSTLILSGQVLDGNGRVALYWLESCDTQSATGLVASAGVRAARPAAGPQIVSLVAVPARRGAVQVVFSLSAPSQVNAEVFTSAGRSVAHLVRGQACPPGSDTLTWTCSSDRGLRVPAGTYLLRLTARGADGRQASRVCTVSVQR